MMRKISFFFGFVMFFSSQLAGAQETEAPGISAVEPNILNEILLKVRQAYRRQERPMVIFDLEGTLFDNRPRISKILREYSVQELKHVRPQEAKAIGGLKLEQIEYRVKDTLESIGINDTAIINNASIFWAERFFTDKYLEYDEPVSGAVEFVRQLYTAGARIVYLSGRDTERQLVGTIVQLKKYGFPIGIQGTEVILRPTIKTPRAMFKQRINQYLRHSGKVIAAFDNEPGNVNFHQRAFGNALCVWFDFIHSSNPPPLLPGIRRIENYDLSAGVALDPLRGAKVGAVPMKALPVARKLDELRLEVATDSSQTDAATAKEGQGE